MDQQCQHRNLQLLVGRQAAVVMDSDALDSCHAAYILNPA